jgi:hypothetical protein
MRALGHDAELAPPAAPAPLAAQRSDGVERRRAPAQVGARAATDASSSSRTPVPDRVARMGAARRVAERARGQLGRHAHLLRYRAARR